MKIVKNNKVIKLRNKSASVEYILRDALAHAHEIKAVFIIEVRKDNCSVPHGFSYSRTRFQEMAWAMNLAQQKANKVISGIE